MSDWLVAGALAALVIFHLGYGYGEPNHTLLLPWILHRMDPSLLAQDWLATTIPHHRNFIVAMAWLGRFVPLPAAMLVLHALSLTLLVWAALRIAGLLFEDWKVFFVGLFLLIRWGTDGLGGNGLWAYYFQPHFAAVPVCLVAFYLMLRDRPVGAAAAAAAATWVHIQLGALTMLVLGLGMLLECRRLGWRELLKTGAVYAALVAPTIAPQWSLYVSAPSPMSPREYLSLHGVLRLPHHLIPSSWAGAEYYRFFLVVGMGAMAVDWKQRLHRRAAAWCGIIFALAIAGTVFVEVWPVKLILKMHLFRSTIFVKFFAVLFVARYLLGLIEAPRALEKACGLAILAIQNFPVIGMCAGLAVAVRQNRRWLWGLGLFGAGCATGAMMVATAKLDSPIPMFWHSFAITMRGLWVGLGTLAALAVICRRNARWLPASLIALAVALRAITGLPMYGYDHPQVDDWVLFCRRVKASTPRDAVFLTPPFIAGFQVFAERAEVVNFKCVPTIETDLLEWKRRLDDLSGRNLRCSGWEQCASDLAGGYVRLTESDLLRLAAKYRAQYVVTFKATHGLHFPEVLRLGDFGLYQLPQQSQ